MRAVRASPHGQTAVAGRGGPRRAEPCRGRRQGVLRRTGRSATRRGRDPRRQHVRAEPRHGRACVAESRAVPDCGTARRSTSWSPRRASIAAATANLCRSSPIRRGRGSSSRGGGCPNRDCRDSSPAASCSPASDETLLVYDLPSGEPIGEPLKWVRRGCTGTRASTHLLTTRYRGNSAWIDLDSREITPFLGIRPGCSVNNNLYPANGVLNMPNLTAGCTCNYAPVSVACVPAGVVERGGGE